MYLVMQHPGIYSHLAMWTQPIAISQPSQPRAVQVMIINYDTLIRNASSTLRDIARFLGLPPPPTCTISPLALPMLPL